MQIYVWNIGICWIFKYKTLLKTLIDSNPLDHCSQIQIEELMNLQLGKSSSNLEDSSQMNIGFGYVLEHYLDFLFSSTSCSLQHWLFWIVSSSHFNVYSLSLMEGKFLSYEPSFLFLNINISSRRCKSSHSGWRKWEKEKKVINRRFAHLSAPRNFWLLFQHQFVC